MALDLANGNALIQQERSANPNNLAAQYVADYEDCLLLLFNGDPKELKQRLPHLDQRLDALSKGDEKSPWYLFSKAAIYFHWAMVQLRFGENLKGAMNFKRSYGLLKENKKKFPSFAQNKILMGAQEAVIGTIPDNYKWIASMFGMKGDVKKGIGELAWFVNNTKANEPLKQEAMILYAYLRYYLLSQQQETWAMLNSKSFPTEGNLLNSFVKINIGLNSRHGEEAYQTLKRAEALPTYKFFPVFDYEMGTALLYKLDNQSVNYFSRFISRFKGDYYVKDAYAKMAQAYYLQQNMAKAQECRNAILKHGAQNVDADKQAQKFAYEKTWTALPVLQARLLIDGGHYQEALNKLAAQKTDGLSITDKLEYYFRLGRAYDELGQDTKAIECYQYTISIGRKRTEHFAARSALQMGLMYERMGKKEEAIKRYNECLSMKDHDFQSGIDQQAKAGINRLTQL